jgi:putative thioredoxin
MTLLTPSQPGGNSGGQDAPGAQQPAGARVIDVDEQSFQAEVVDRSHDAPVVIDFWAPWCGPCRTLGPVLEKLAGEARGAWVLAKINVDENPRLAQAFGVQGIPAVKAVHQGRLVAEFTGAQPESQVRTWLKRFVPERAEEAPPEDLAALAERDPQAATQRYRAILAKTPDDAAAMLGLGRLLLAAGDGEGAALLKGVPVTAPQYQAAQGWLTLGKLVAEADREAAFELLARVDQDPADLEARYQLAAHQIGGQRNEDAIEHQLEIVARNRELREDGARKALLALFAALGDQHPLVASARRRLANLLF